MRTRVSSIPSGTDLHRLVLQRTPASPICGETLPVRFVSYADRARSDSFFLRVQIQPANNLRPARYIRDQSHDVHKSEKQNRLRTTQVQRKLICTRLHAK